MLVVHTLDQLGRTVRDTLNMVHELKERGVGIRTLADPLAIDTQAGKSHGPDGVCHADPVRADGTHLGGRTRGPFTGRASQRPTHRAAVRGRPSQARTRCPAPGQRCDRAGDNHEDRSKRTTLYRHLPPRSPAAETVGSPSILVGLYQITAGSRLRRQAVFWREMPQSSAALLHDAEVA